MDGGASRSGPLLQFQADLLQRDVIRPACIETTALGAAYLAGLAVGFWRNRTEIADKWREAEWFHPRSTPQELQPLKDGWAKALSRSRKWWSG